MATWSIWHWIGVIVFELLWIVPVWRILRRIGHPRGLALVVGIPFLGMILMWWIAYSRWPREFGPDPAIFS
jgi:hypothetical protein